MPEGMPDDIGAGEEHESSAPEGATDGPRAGAGTPEPRTSATDSSEGPTTGDLLKAAKSNGDTLVKEFVTQFNFMNDSQSLESMQLFVEKLATMVEEMQNAPGGRRGDLSHAKGKRYHDRRHGEGKPRPPPNAGTRDEFNKQQGPGRPKSNRPALYLGDEPKPRKRKSTAKKTKAGKRQKTVSG